MNPTIAQTKPHFSIPSIVAIGAAIASLFVRPGTGIILAIIAIIFGVIGFLFSLAPSIRGGLISIFSFFLASIGIVIAIVRVVLR
jgi:hypothetical protein